MEDEACKVHGLHSESIKRAKQLMLDDRSYADMAETFSALADSNRVKIIYSLISGELCVCDIAEVTGISESAVSQHLRILRTLRLVKVRKAGRMAFYSLDDDHIETLVNICLEHIQHS